MAKCSRMSLQSCLYGIYVLSLFLTLTPSSWNTSPSILQYCNAFTIIPTTTPTLPSSLWKSKKAISAPTPFPPLSTPRSSSSSSISTTCLHVAASSSSSQYTIQILMSDTGGGHRASANALSDALEVLYPGQIECDIVDIYTEYGPFWPFNWYVPAYKIMAEYSFLWKTFYEFGSTDFGLWLNELVLDTFCFEPFQKCLARPSGSTSQRADMVVSVHPLCQDLPLKILANLDSNGKSKDPSQRTTPFATVVTDLGGAHPTWFNSGVDKCFVPSEVLYDCARARKVKPSQIAQYGLPIRKGFWGSTQKEDNQNPIAKWFQPKSDNKTSSTSTDALRQKLGLQPSIPTVLVVGGGDGMGGIVQVAKSLGDKLSSDATSTSTNYQMVVVCGNNQSAQQTLSKDTQFGDGLSVHIEGFVNNMDEYMKASDAIVTKAGPGTIAEASICGLPCMLSSYLPGQEEGNVPYVENAGFGQYSGDPETIANTVSTWLASPDMLKQMKASALKAARPQATLDIARDLAEMVFERRRNKE